MKEESLELPDLLIFHGSYLVIGTANIQPLSVLVQSDGVFVPGLFTLLQKVQDGEV